LIRTAGQIPTILVTAGQVPRAKAKVFEAAGVQLLAVREGRDGLDLRGMLEEFHRRGMANVLVEGGGRTLGALLRSRAGGRSGGVHLEKIDRR
jgi:diaminohydroxyphosphoribosylaminopyrimidine deaminase/5-amino-6-(5-phosphoribosylamino)uracil reductase